MSLADINPLLLKPKGNGYETLRDAIKTSVKNGKPLKTITKRDALFLVNKQMEGISETRGNLYIYMFYFACNPKGKEVQSSPEWFKGLRPNDTASNESTPWCACYTSFALNWSGISPHGHYGSNNQADAHNLTQNTDFSTAKSMDLIQYGVSGEGHTCFLLKESTENPNNYKITKRNGLDLPFYQVGGNQSDSVNITRPSKPRLNGFYSNSEYEAKINSGDMLSVLAYFVNANLKTIEERKQEINARLDGNIVIGTALEKEVKEVRTLIDQMPTTANDEAKKARFNSALSIINSSLIDKEEEVVVPIMKSKFGEFGFKFEETGVGDAMKVKFGSSSIEIDLDPAFASTEASEATKLKNFIKPKFKLVSSAGGYFLNNISSNKEFQNRFKELLVFEQSLLDSDLPLTQNVTGVAAKDEDKTR